LNAAQRRAAVLLACSTAAAAGTAVAGRASPGPPGARTASTAVAVGASSTAAAAPAARGLPAAAAVRASSTPSAGGRALSTTVAARSHSATVAAPPSSTHRARAPADAAGAAAIAAVGAENEYADVIAQIGGRYVKVSAIESNPNTDPHTFEASASVAHEVAAADLVVQNGLGYDDYMNKIEAASPSRARRVLDAQKLLGLPDSTPNPHLWYRPGTMAAVAAAVARDLTALEPSHAAYFKANATAFGRSLQPWLAALRSIAASYPHTPVAVTEPVGDYMLSAAGANILTPFTFQADVMNGVDPAPQAVSFEQSLFAGHRVKVFLYNQQVTDSLTKSFLADAAKYHIPVVGVYETMPLGYHYQSWMLAEIGALRRALASGISTQRL
jgi:zinc/manganese transport system substrate-binding protein